MEKETNKDLNFKYPNLDGLRFIAAITVLVFHVELYKKFYGLPNLMYLEFFKIVGKLGVVLFFVLSGFLITSLLLKERDKTGTINFKKFYLRRILRIWPLYFLILFIGFFVLPHFESWKIPSEFFVSVVDHFWLKLFLYVVILPNLAVAIFHEIVGVSQVWSLGTEEQFYLLWPLLIKHLRKRIVPAMLCVLLFYWFVKIATGKLAATSEIWTSINNFWSFFNINCMAIGGISAVLFYDGYSKIINVIFSPIIFILLLVFTVGCLSQGIHFGFFHYDIYAFLFSIIILNLACNTRYNNILEYKTLNYLGSVSYGLYMYHPMVLPIAIVIGKNYENSILIYPITIIFTVVLSILSFEYFEKYFLKKKDKIN